MHSANFSMHRVKLYKLSQQGQWEDKGTGHISVEYMEQANAMGLVVISEDENGETLLVHKISRGDKGEEMYSRSGGEEPTIITWHDPEFATDIAISFQEQVGCDHIWQQIKQVQREEDARQLDSADSSGGRKSDDRDGPGGGVGLMNGMSRDNDPELPSADRRHLEDIAKALIHVPPNLRDRTAAQLLKPNYINSLMELFKQCEDLEDTEGLTHMYTVVRSAIMLNDSGVLEELLREEHVMDVLGALEYDPDLKSPQKYREFLQSHVQFKEVVPITNPQILAKIHQTYRIQYLKDVILPRSLDDATYATLSSLALFNNMEVVGALMQDSNFLPQLFARLQGADTTDAQWHDLVAFLQEFCNLARHLQQLQRAQLFSRLLQLGLFDVVTLIMVDSNDEIKLKATDVLMSAMQHDVAALRTFMYQQADYKLFSLLVRELTDSTDAGLAEQVCEVLKVLLDPDTMEQNIEKNEFLEVFYDKYLPKLEDVIKQDAATNREGTRVVPATTLGLLVDLLCFCVTNHSYRIKYYTLRANLVGNVLRVARRREKWLVCTAVRFLRTCVAMKDEFFQRYLLRNNLLGPVMAVFFENGDRYNLVNSTVLELIDFIASQNMKPLVEHLVETYGPRLDDITYVETFRKLRLRYDQAPERAGDAGAGAAGGGAEPSNNSSVNSNGGAAAGAGAGGVMLGGRKFVFSPGDGISLLGRRRRRDDRDLEKDEEDYFSEDVGEVPLTNVIDDDDDGGGRAGGGGGMVDGSNIGADLGRRSSSHHHQQQQHHHHASGGGPSREDGPAAGGPHTTSTTTTSNNSAPPLGDAPPPHHQQQQQHQQHGSSGSGSGSGTGVLRLARLRPPPEGEDAKEGEESLLGGGVANGINATACSSGGDQGGGGGAPSLRFLRVALVPLSRLPSEQPSSHNGGEGSQAEPPGLIRLGQARAPAGGAAGGAKSGAGAALQGGHGGSGAPTAQGEGEPTWRLTEYDDALDMPDANNNDDGGVSPGVSKRGPGGPGGGDHGRRSSLDSHHGSGINLEHRKRPRDSDGGDEGGMGPNDAG